MNGATQDHDPTGARSRACKHHLLVPGNRPTAGRRYRRRHCQRDLSGCTPLRPPRLCSRARRREGNGHALHPQPHETILTRSSASSSRLDGHTIWMLVVRRAASSTGSMRDCSPITNPIRPKLGAFSWIIEIIHHSADAILLQHSAITLWLTYGDIIGGGAVL
jgi:hypothetical protein